MVIFVVLFCPNKGHFPYLKTTPSERWIPFSNTKYASIVPRQVIKKSFVTDHQKFAKYIHFCNVLSNYNSHVPIIHPFTNWELACPRQEAEFIFPIKLS